MFASLRVTRLIGVFGFAAMFGMAGAASAQITGTPHDMSGNTIGDGEICVVCHAPHDNTTAKPLWNRQATLATTYTLYTNADSMDMLQGTLGPASVACLSCHDGTIALENFGGVTTGATMISAGNQVGTVTATVNNNLGTEHPLGITYNPTLDTAFQPLDAGNDTAGSLDLPLFSGQVECGTCHDPHDAAGLGPTGKFLRAANTNSVLCLSCHIK